MSFNKIQSIVDALDSEMNGLEMKSIEVINGALERSFNDLELELRRRMPKLQENTGLLQAQANSLELAKQVQALMVLVNPEQAKAIESRLEDLISESSTLGIGSVKQTVELTGMTLDFAPKIPAKAIALAASESLKRLQSHGEDFARGATTIITQSLIQGWGVDKAVSLMRGNLALTKTKAETIVRTESMQAFTRSADATMAGAGIEYVSRLTAIGSSVCPVCAGRAGEITKRVETIAILHPRCRCVLIPAIPGLINLERQKSFHEAVSKKLPKGVIADPHKLSPFEKANGISKPKPIWDYYKGSTKNFQDVISGQAAVKEAKAKEAAVKEAKAKEAKEVAAKEAKAKEAKEAKAKEVAAKEAKAKEAKAKEVAAKEAKAKEAKEAKAKEVAAKEAKAKEAKEAKAKEVAAKEVKAKEAAVKEAFAKATTPSPSKPTRSSKSITQQKRDELLKGLEKIQAKNKKESIDMPDDPGELTVIEVLGGSTGAELVTDKQGRKFVRKRGASLEHMREEMLADDLYRSMGVDVPKGKIYKDKNGEFKLTEYIEGKSFGDLKGKEKNMALEALKQSFAADALMGNWDVIGLNQDNVLFGNDGKLYRIDNGGSLRFRAQGGSKSGTQFNEYPTEIWSMRNNSVFDSLDIYEVLEQASKLQFTLPENSDQEVGDILSSRLKEMKRMAEIATDLKKDKWKSDYADDFFRHMTGIRQDGISESMAQELKSDEVEISVGGERLKVNEVRLFDENGKKFDNLRGNQSATDRFRLLLNSSGGDWNIIESYANAQRHSSWSGKSVAIKTFMAKQRDAEEEDFFWKKGSKAKGEKGLADLARDHNGSQTVRESITAFHAYNFEVMDNIGLQNKEGRSVKVYRTESDGVVGRNSMKQGESSIYKRGAIESTSLVQPIGIYGKNLVEFKVPIHRIFANYMTNVVDECLFLEDKENELTVMLEGIEGKYLGKLDEASKNWELDDALSELGFDDDSEDW